MILKIKKNCVAFIEVFLVVEVIGQEYNYNEIRKTFGNQFETLLGNGKLLTKNNLESLFSQRSCHWSEKDHLSRCLNTSSGIADGKCLLSQCISPAEVYHISGISENTTEKELCTLSWILFHQSENLVCNETDDEITADYHKPPTKTEVWGFGVLCTTVIVLCTLGGLLALPFIHGVNYRRVLIFMVGLAVGTLSGSSLLVLAPEALELEYEELDSHSYIWKCLVMLAAIYTFFLLEKFLKLLTKFKEHKREKRLRYQVESSRYGPRQIRRHSHVRSISMSVIAENETGKVNGSIQERSEETDPNISVDKPVKGEIKHVAPVAWMILLGDGVHNFIDGVSLGAAFSESVSAGVSVSVAIVCEELPHELGDFAVLLTAGMSKKPAAFYNVLSGCTIYVGMVVGIFLGENEQAHTWVFAFASGMFLYIALVDMLPEMIVAAESKENIDLIGGGMIFFLQNLGLLVGFGAILTLALLGDQLDEAITNAQL